jgi:hypothetical protein
MDETDTLEILNLLVPRQTKLSGFQLIKFTKQLLTEKSYNTLFGETFNHQHAEIVDQFLESVFKFASSKAETVMLLKYSIN